MTVVVLAGSYEQAATVARAMGLGQNFIYPHRVELLQGVRVEQVIYVEGWLTSTAITLEVAEFVHTRLTQDAAVLTVALDRDGEPVGIRHPQALLSAPFVPPVYPENVLGPWRPRRRRLAPWVLILGYALACGLAGGIVYRLGVAWGWWA